MFEGYQPERAKKKVWFYCYNFLGGVFLWTFVGLRDNWYSLSSFLLSNIIKNVLSRLKYGKFFFVSLSAENVLNSRRMLGGVCDKFYRHSGVEVYSFGKIWRSRLVFLFRYNVATLSIFSALNWSFSFEVSLDQTPCWDPWSDGGRFVLINFWGKKLNFCENFEATANLELRFQSIFFFKFCCSSNHKKIQKFISQLSSSP